MKRTTINKKPKVRTADTFAEKLDKKMSEFAKRYSKTFQGLAAGEAFNEDAFFADNPSK